jgi:hypothetical protein
MISWPQGNPKEPAMKHNHNHDNAPSAGPQLQPVRFEFTHPTATTVCLAGTYEYCLVVDGQWMPDPLARESVPNPFGGRNSILKVSSSPEAGHRADADNLPLKNVNKPKTQKI